MIYHFQTLGSSNDEAKESKYSHGDVVVAESQSAGRGQRGNKWLSGEGLNLTLSIVLCPHNFKARDQFLVSQAVALGICDMLQSYWLDARIKWTNDIYIGERKIVGILIENSLSGAQLSRSVVGIGLNVNQREFDALLPNPTSMILECGQSVDYDRDEVLDALISAILQRIDLLGVDTSQIAEEYHKRMYRLGESHPFRLPSGVIHQGAIQGVAPGGELKITWHDGQCGSYLFGEVEFVIESRNR